MKLTGFVPALSVILFSSLVMAQQPLPDPLKEWPIPAGLGVNIHFTDPKPGELEQLYAGGFRWVRVDFGWAGIERQKGQYDFAAFDRLLAALEAHHIRAYFILDYSNPHFDDNLSPHSDEGRAAFAAWAAASVHHFKGHGILWEMYNEPNIQFWRPKPNVDDYALLAMAVGKAIHDAEPGEIYIGPATSLIDFPFIETCFKAGCLQCRSTLIARPTRKPSRRNIANCAC